MLTVRKCQIHEKRNYISRCLRYDMLLNNYIINRLDIFSIELFQIVFTICKSWSDTTALYFCIQSRKIVTILPFVKF